MRRTRSTVAATAIVMTIVMVLSGCGAAAEEIAESAIESEAGGDVELDVNEDGGRVDIETEDGSMTFGGGEVPDDLGIPVVDGGEVISTMQNTVNENAMVSASLQYETDRYDELVGFYTDWIADTDAMKTESSNADGRSTFWFISGHPTLGEASVSIIESPDGALVSLSSQSG